MNDRTADVFQNERQEVIKKEKEKKAHINIIMHIISVRDTRGSFYALSLPETFRAIGKYVVACTFVYFPQNGRCFSRIPRSTAVGG